MVFKTRYSQGAWVVKPLFSPWCSCIAYMSVNPRIQYKIIMPLCWRTTLMAGPTCRCTFCPLYSVTVWFPHYSQWLLSQWWFHPHTLFPGTVHTQLSFKISRMAVENDASWDRTIIKMRYLYIFAFLIFKPDPVRFPTWRRPRNSRWLVTSFTVMNMDGGGVISEIVLH